MKTTTYSSRNASAAGEWLVRACSEQYSALMPIVKDPGLSSTHLCWEQCGQFWLFTVQVILTNLSLSFTRPVFHMYKPPFILQRSITRVFLRACTSKEQFKCYYDKLLANSCVSEVTDTLLLLQVSISHSGERLWFMFGGAKPSSCCSQLTADRCELCVLQRLLNTSTSRFIQLAFGIRLEGALNPSKPFCTSTIPKKHEN